MYALSLILLKCIVLRYLKNTYCSFDDIASLRRVITAGAFLKLPLWKCMEKPVGDNIKTVNHSKFSMFLAGLVVLHKPV